MANTHAPTTEIQHEVTLFAEPLFNIGWFTVTNSLLTSWIVILTLILVSIALRRSLKQIPKGIQNVFEVVVEGSLGIVDQVTGDRRLSTKIFPIAFTIFVFVLLYNWMGILPGIGSIGQIALHDGHAVFVPFFRGGTADLNTTLALALMSVIGANIFGAVTIGLWKTLNKFINLRVLGGMFTKVKKDPSVLIVAPITFFVGLIEIVSEIAKIASLSFRLFGNVFAGEVLLAAMAAIFAYVTPIPFLFLEILVGFIQALIFAMLTTVYFTIASHDHDHDESGAHGEAVVAKSH